MQRGSGQTKPGKRKKSVRHFVNHKVFVWCIPMCAHMRQASNRGNYEVAARRRCRKRGQPLQKTPLGQILGVRACTRRMAGKKEAHLLLGEKLDCGVFVPAKVGAGQHRLLLVHPGLNLVHFRVELQQEQHPSQREARMTSPC